MTFILIEKIGGLGHWMGVISDFRWYIHKKWCYIGKWFKYGVRNCSGKKKRLRTLEKGLYVEEKRGRTSWKNFRA